MGEVQWGLLETLLRVRRASFAFLADDTGRGILTVRKSIRALENRGLVDVDRSGKPWEVVLRVYNRGAA